jgi:hypothetical protein
MRFAGMKLAGMSFSGKPKVTDCEFLGVINVDAR